MLGRLFKDTPSTVSSGTTLDNPAINSPSTTSFDDQYTRETLYGTSEHLRAFTLHNKLFRLVVAQDGGSLRIKQVLFDSSAEQKSPVATGYNTGPTTGPVLGISQSKGMHSSRIHHNTSDLCDYMFGCGLPTNEQHLSTKIHVLPELHHGPGARLVLITRLFLISNNEEYQTNTPSDGLWNPQAAFPIKETSLATSKSINRPKGGINSRFAIGVVVPIDDLDEAMADILFGNWNELSHFLIILQKVVTKRLIQQLELHPSYLVNLRLQFPQHILQNESDLHAYVVKLIKLVFYDAGTARLFSNNSIMYHKGSSEAQMGSQMAALRSITTHNWVSEALNWLEYKEGHSGPNNTSGGSQVSFLAALIALILPLRHILQLKPMALLQSQGEDSKDSTGVIKSHQVCRIVVMTGNPLVAKKLVFILNGLIPSRKFDHIIVSNETSSEPSIKTSTSSIKLNMSDFQAPRMSSFDVDDRETEHSTHQLQFLSYMDIPSPGRKSYSIPENGWYDETLVPPSPSTMRGIDSEPLVKPIAIRQKCMSNSPDSIGSLSGVRGWEIPAKASSSVKSPVEELRAMPIIQHVSVNRNGGSGQGFGNGSGHGTLSKSSSMAYLSLSLNLSLSSSALNYSLLKLSGSFFDKWKSSFGSSTTASNPDFSSGSAKRMSSFRTPLPAIEHEEFSWNTPRKLNKAQLMMDMQNANIGGGLRWNGSTNGLILEVTRSKGLNVKRTRVSVFCGEHYNYNDEKELKNKKDSKETSKHPTQINPETTSDTNRAIVERKCAAIFESRPSYDNENGTLIVTPIGSTSGNYRSNSSATTKNNTSAGNLLLQRCTLPPHVAFTEEFRPEFGVQLCPVNPRLETMVMNAMKNDLLFFLNNCGVESVTSKTVFISLRAREVKVIEMKLCGESHVPGDVGANQYKTNVRKVFTGQRAYGNDKRIGEVEERLRELSKAYGLRQTTQMQQEVEELLKVD